MSTAVISIVIGKKYRKIYDRYFRDSHERFAQKIGAEFIPIYNPIEITTKHPSWQKLLIFRNQEVSKHDRVIFVDADIYITENAENPFAVVPEGFWGMVNNNEYGIPEIFESDKTLYDNCPKDFQPNHTLNGGFFVADKKTHKDIFEYIFSTYPEQNCYEQGFLSFHLQRDFKGVILPGTFNAVLAAYRMKYGKGLSKIIDFYGNNGFIHFAGGIPITLVKILRIIDTKPNTLAAKIIRIFSHKNFDSFTTCILRALSAGKKIKTKLKIS